MVNLNAIAPAWRLPDAHARRIANAAPDGWEVVVVSAPTVSDGDGGSPPSDEALEAIRSAEIYAGFGIPRALFLAARELRWVHSATAGIGSALYPEMVQSDVLLTNSAGVHAVPIAEYVIGGVLYFTRGFDLASKARAFRGGVRAREGAEPRWDREPFISEASPIRELGELRALVVGAGGIGSAVAERLTALGVRCTGIRRRPELGVPRGFERVAGPADVDSLLPEADLVILAAPYAAGSGHLVDARRLDLLPAQAIVVNVARGALLDEEALVERLESGRLRGAVLDVYGVEPLPEASPLWGCERALLSPHVSAVSPRGFWERQTALLLENWERYRRGDKLRNLVDKEAGY